MVQDEARKGEAESRVALSAVSVGVLAVSAAAIFIRLAEAPALAAGQELPQQAIHTWAAPVLQPNLELAPGDSFEMAIPIDNFYQLASGRAFWVALEYGNQNLKVTARTCVTVP